MELEKIGLPALKLLMEARDKPKASAEVKQSTQALIDAQKTALRKDLAIVQILTEVITYKNKMEVQMAKEVLETLKKRYESSKPIIELLDKKLAELNELEKDLS
jgi:hypothetical protein